jgi:hypothetical protein
MQFGEYDISPKGKSKETLSKWPSVIIHDVYYYWIPP